MTPRMPALSLVAVAVGLACGAAAVGFRWLIEGVTFVATGHTDYSGAGGAAHPLLPGLGGWFVLAVPVLGGLLYGPLVARFAPEARGHGVPEVMLAVARQGGRIRPRVAVVKSLASALCIGTGGSVGREGPIVQIGSALGSVAGQRLGFGADRMRLLVACGAAAGVAATFNAPVAGVFFALEVILRDFEVEAIGMVVLSAVAASVVGRLALGSAPFLALPAFRVVSLVELGLYAALGALAAVVGIAFVRVLYGMEDLADEVWRGPDWARPAAGGVLLGVLLLLVPQMYGVGYPVLERAVDGREVLLALVGLLVAKVLATSLTLAIGGSGGVFAPSLFTGAMLGAAFGTVAHAALPALTAPAGAYAVVGMAAVFAATARAPIAAVLIVFELTGDYAIILPLMLAVAVAAGLANALTADTVYTLKLRRRGIILPRERTAMGAIGATQALLHGVGSPWDGAPVPSVTTEQTLEDVVALLADPDVEAVAVVEAGDRERPLGWLGHREVLVAYHRHATGAAAVELGPEGGEVRGRTPSASEPRPPATLGG